MTTPDQHRRPRRAVFVVGLALVLAVGSVSAYAWSTAGSRTTAGKVAHGEVLVGVAADADRATGARGFRPTVSAISTSPNRLQPLYFVITFPAAPRNALTLEGVRVSVPKPDSGRWIGLLPLGGRRYLVALNHLRTDGKGDGWIRVQVRRGAVVGPTGQRNLASNAARIYWDRTAPPAPRLTSVPPNPSSASTAIFAFDDRESNVAFECSVDASAFRPCHSPFATTVSEGGHTFSVRATDHAGNRSRATSYAWTVTAHGLPFSISGSVTGLAPGVLKPILVTVSNPNSVAIYVTSLTVTPAADSSPSGCSAAQNVQVVQSGTSASTPLTVSAHGSVTLPAQGASAPQIGLKDLLTINQDVCKGKSFALSYSGSAHS